jgi:hypothetical protein
MSIISLDKVITFLSALGCFSFSVYKVRTQISEYKVIKNIPTNVITKCIC